MSDLHPSIRHFVPLFRYKHLPKDLQALRKLLEAKDGAVRAEGFAKWKEDADGE